MSLVLSIYYNIPLKALGLGGMSRLLASQKIWLFGVLGPAADVEKLAAELVMIPPQDLLLLRSLSLWCEVDEVVVVAAAAAAVRFVFSVHTLLNWTWPVPFLRQGRKRYRNL